MGGWDWRNKPSVKNSWSYQEIFRTRRDAREKSVPHKVKPVYVWTLQVTHCPELGIELDYNVSAEGENSATLSMINPALGYVPDNVRVVSWKAEYTRAHTNTQN